jgi:hypothetical protein
MQLVAYGAQDIYLTAKPEITFWKVMYRRHSNFAMESIEQTFNGTADWGKKVTCTISRNGDLIHRVYLQVTIPAVAGTGYFAWVNYIGNTMIKEVELEIGGQKIDKHYADWLNIWAQLTQTAEQFTGYKSMVGETSALTTNNATAKAQTVLYVPLQFFFCRYHGLALPLIALQYHEVKINLEFRPKAECYMGDEVPGSLVNASLYVDYIYLDVDERRKYAQLPHEYLIEQLQFTGAESLSATSNKVRLNFNHPVKELVWAAQLDTRVATASNTDTGNVNQWTNWLDASSVNLTSNAKLQLNGHDRFSQRDGTYFNLVQPYQHHTRIPDSAGVNVYSFALKPEDHQPSGSCNFSRIDTVTLQLTQTTSAAHKLRVYATNYNVLRIISGMGGLAYAN